MSAEENTEIYQVLYDRREEIAKIWFETLSNLTPKSLDASELEPSLLDYTDRIIESLVGDSFEAKPIQEVGAALDQLVYLQSDGLLKVQNKLASNILNALSIEQRAAVSERLPQLLNVMGIGFYAAKAERTKQFNMQAMSKMGHDLKTPINAVTGFSRVILKGIDGPITDFQKEDLTSIFEAGNKLLTMVNDLFETAKKDAQKTGVYASTFEVAPLLGDILMTAQPLLAKQKHSLKVQGQGHLGSMRANASEVRWVLLGLLLHVSRLAENHVISLSATRERVDEVDYLKFEISEALSDAPAPSAPEATVERTAAIVYGEDEIAVITSRRFCDAMGGTMSLAMDDEGLAQFSVQLPAYVTPEPSTT